MYMEWLLLVRTLYIDQYQYQWINLAVYLVLTVPVKSGIGPPLVSIYHVTTLYFPLMSCSTQEAKGELLLTIAWEGLYSSYQSPVVLLLLMKTVNLVARRHKKVTTHKRNHYTTEHQK